ncbi:putative metal-binding motif-containing protein, partial [Myxococcota bacterium]|nr:putative metal-binding motif-containing protein [Myxococcota bacterium]
MSKRMTKNMSIILALAWSVFACEKTPVVFKGRPCTVQADCVSPDACDEVAGFCIGPLDISCSEEEVCDGLDNDCDGLTDEDLPVYEYYQDLDADGYGQPGSTKIVGCELPPGMALSDDDCDETNDEIYPGAEDGFGNGVDENCDGSDGVDADGDGVASISSGGEDCDDTSILCTFDCTTDVDDDGRDCDDSCVDGDGDMICADLDKCQTVSDFANLDSDGDCPLPPYESDPECGDACDSCTDVDSDTYGTWPVGVLSSCAGYDCDDSRDDIHPGAAEICDGLDNDCDTLIDEDLFAQDSDLDGVCDAMDICRDLFDPLQADFNADCPSAPYSSDPVCGDACADSDGDGEVDDEDNCPVTLNAAQTDTDRFDTILSEDLFTQDDG